MNPNSANQRWSAWRITVQPGRVQPSATKAEAILPAVARFTRALFGSVTQMRVLTQTGAVTFEVRTEGAPVHDEKYVTHVTERYAGFFQRGFGPGTVTTVDARLLAGSREDGSASDQLVMLPTLAVQ